MVLSNENPERHVRHPLLHRTTKVHCHHHRYHPNAVVAILHCVVEILALGRQLDALVELEPRDCTLTHQTYLDFLLFLMLLFLMDVPLDLDKRRSNHFEPPLPWRVVDQIQIHRQQQQQ